MQTRSQSINKTSYQPCENAVLIIDFDEASAAWLANKIRLGNGMYSYKEENTRYNLRSRNKL